MSNPFDYQKFSTFVNGIVDRKVRAIAVGVTSSTGYFKNLIAQAASYASASQTSATAAQTSAVGADASSTSATIIYNSFTSSFLGILASDPQKTSTGNTPNKGAFYIRSADNHLRVATAIVNGTVTWADAAVAADATSIVSAGAGYFLSIIAGAAPQSVPGKVTFANTIFSPRVTDWTTQQVATAVDVKTLTDALTVSVTNETNRALSAEAANASALGVETTRAKAAEAANATALGTEQTRALGIEGGLRTDLTAETNRAKAVEGNLQTAANNEINRAIAAEGVVQASVTNETNRATSIEGGLRTDLTTEVTRAKAAEASNASAITSESSRAAGVEGGLRTDLTTETNRAKGAETGLTNSLSGETARAVTAETGLGNSIANETARAISQENGLSGYTTSVLNSLNAETNRAKAAEGVNATAISTETARALAAESAAQTNAQNYAYSRAETRYNDALSNDTNVINTAIGLINAEGARAQGAEGGLSSRITQTYTDFPNDYVAKDNSVRSDLTTLVNNNGASAVAQSRAYTDAALGGFTGQFQANSNGNGYYERRANGVIEQWGLIGATGAEGSYTINFPISFGNPNSIMITAMSYNASATNNRDIWPQIVSRSASGCVVFMQWTGINNTSQYMDGIFWRAVGFNYTPSGGDPSAAGTTYGGGAGGGNDPGTGGGGGGGGAGGDCPETATPILLSNEDQTGPGQYVTAGELRVGDYVWTRHEKTMDWGAYKVVQARSFIGVLWKAEGYYRSTKNHPLYLNDAWVTINEIGIEDSDGTAVAITVENAHTFIGLDLNGNQVLNHNIKNVQQV